MNLPYELRHTTSAARYRFVLDPEVGIVMHFWPAEGSPMERRPMTPSAARSYADRLIATGEWQPPTTTTPAP